MALFSAFGLLGIALAPTALGAGKLTAKFENKADVVVGNDLWEVTYRLIEPPLTLDQGFTIYFDYRGFSSINLVSSPDPGWDVLIIQPDLALPDDGFVDGLATVTGLPPGEAFVVSFDWLGPKVPGSQHFEVYDLSGGGFQVVLDGTTTVLDGIIPESGFGLATGSVALMALGVLQLWASHWRRSDNRPSAGVCLGHRI